MVAGCPVLHSLATGSAQPQRLRASPPRQDQNHRASGSEWPGFVPNPHDKGSRLSRVSGHESVQGNARTLTMTLANQLPRSNLGNGGSVQSAQVATRGIHEMGCSLGGLVRLERNHNF